MSETRRAPALALVLALLGALLIPGAPAAAHPFGETFESHRLKVNITRDTLTLDYQCEIPTPRVMTDFLAFLGDVPPSKEGDRAFTASRLAQLQRELEIFVNGERLPLRELSPAEGKNGRGNARFFVYDLLLEGDLHLRAGQSTEIIVFNHNGPLEGSYYQSEVTLGPGLVLDAATHLGTDAEGGWSPDPVQRNLTLTVTSPSPLPPPWMMGAALGALGALGYSLWRWRRSPTSDPPTVPPGAHNDAHARHSGADHER